MGRVDELGEGRLELATVLAFAQWSTRREHLTRQSLKLGHKAVFEAQVENVHLSFLGWGCQAIRCRRTLCRREGAGGGRLRALGRGRGGRRRDTATVAAAVSRLGSRCRPHSTTWLRPQCSTGEIWWNVQTTRRRRGGTSQQLPCERHEGSILCFASHEAIHSTHHEARPILACTDNGALARQRIQLYARGRHNDEPDRGTVGPQSPHAAKRVREALQKRAPPTPADIRIVWRAAQRNSFTTPPASVGGLQALVLRQPHRPHRGHVEVASPQGVEPQRQAPLGLGPEQLRGRLQGTSVRHLCSEHVDNVVFWRGSRDDEIGGRALRQSPEGRPRHGVRV
mmetsp:Transcript_18612/g.60537  ORF Transcript_18612/g.60537 Transcript_18612/m.60537 type:complete len:339 (+) Transcript_18612:1067-2083(+)